MNLSRFGILIFVSAMSFAAAAAQTSARRDLPPYDNGGTLDFEFLSHSKFKPELAAKLRGFLWEHWSKKRRGRINALFRSIEGDEHWDRYYVEPDKNGNWQIVLDWERFCCNIDFLKDPNAKIKSRSGRDVYAYAERVDPVFRGCWAATLWSALAFDDDRTPDRYVLVLKKKSSDRGGEDI